MKQIISQKAKKHETTNKTKHWAPPLFRQMLTSFATIGRDRQ